MPGSSARNEAVPVWVFRIVVTVLLAVCAYGATTILEEQKEQARRLSRVEGKLELMLEMNRE